MSQMKIRNWIVSTCYTLAYIIIGMVSLIPLVIVANYSLFHMMIFGEDFTSTKFVQVIIRPLVWIDEKIKNKTT